MVVLSPDVVAYNSETTCNERVLHGVQSAAASQALYADVAAAVHALHCQHKNSILTSSLKIYSCLPRASYATSTCRI